MPAEIISIGDELTSGQRLDTNSQWLSQRLGELGIPVMFHTTVGDDLDANIAVFRAAIARADVVVATGGLGPTADDLTRDALAAAVGVELVEDDGCARTHPNTLRAAQPRDAGTQQAAGTVSARQPGGAESARARRRASISRYLASVQSAVPRVRAARRAGGNVRDVE